ncbi:MAG: sigma-70 family RNA polymerase sigma factor [Myxococcota bacterium]
MLEGEDELETLYRRYFPLLEAKAHRILADPVEAQDVAQQAFMHLLRHGADITGGSPGVIRWLYRTATHLSIDRLRHLKVRGPRELFSDLPCPSSDPQRTIEARQAWDEIARRLSARELEVLVLTRIDRLTQAQAAELLGVSERTVRRRVERARDKIKNAQECDDDDG